jgi:hypothetical protein
VTIVYPNGSRVENITLARVPIAGEDVRLKRMRSNEPSLVCEKVLLPEGEDAIVMVRERPNGR